MELLKLKTFSEYTYSVENGDMVIPTIFTNKVFHSDGYNGHDEITRYTVNLQVTDQDTNQSIADVIQQKIGKLSNKVLFSYL